jgi:hypothetical protein
MGDSAMNTTMLKHVRTLFVREFVPTSTARHNMRQWVKSVRMLGDKHLLAIKVAKKETT